MKKMIILAGIVATLICLGTTVYADDVMKIGLNAEVKAAKAVGNGRGITFTLSDIANNFLIDTIELAIFEKQENETNYEKFGESKMVENLTSLNISFDFGDVSKYKPKAKYKIAYRYYVKPIDDLSKILIAGEDVKEGWRLVGEINPTVQTEQGFVFYKNTSPALSVEGIVFVAETISGTTTFSYPLNQLENVYLPSDALQKGVTVDYTTDDYDIEDSLSVKYQLFDGITNEHIYTGIFDSSKTIYSSTNAELIKVVISAKDNWDGESDKISFVLKIDKEFPTVINQFEDTGRPLRGGNLFSKFTITDNQNEVLTSGNVYCSIKSNGVMVYQNIQIPNHAGGVYTVDIPNQQDGEYEMILTIFDKAHNKATHTLRQTLDNTAPVIRFLRPDENPNVTEYSVWTNKSKKIMFTATDKYAGIKKCNQYLNNSIYTSIEHIKPQMEYTYTFNVSTTKTGQLYYHFNIYDNACTINKTTNTVNTNIIGNTAFASNYVWLDKTPPSVTINANSNIWYPTSATINVSAFDYPSTSGISDNSGVKSIQYCITDSEICDNNWMDYDFGVTFNQGGIYYLHIKAVDFAGNEAIASKRIMINTNGGWNGKTKTSFLYCYTILINNGDFIILSSQSLGEQYYWGRSLAFQNLATTVTDSWWYYSHESEIPYYVIQPQSLYINTNMEEYLEQLFITNNGKLYRVSSWSKRGTEESAMAYEGLLYSTTYRYQTGSTSFPTYSLDGSTAAKLKPYLFQNGEIMYSDSHLVKTSELTEANGYISYKGSFGNNMTSVDYSLITPRNNIFPDGRSITVDWMGMGGSLYEVWYNIKNADGTQRSKGSTSYSTAFSSSLDRYPMMAIAVKNSKFIMCVNMVGHTFIKEYYRVAVVEETINGEISTGNNMGKKNITPPESSDTEPVQRSINFAEEDLPIGFTIKDHVIGTNKLDSILRQQVNTIRLNDIVILKKPGYISGVQNTGIPLSKYDQYDYDFGGTYIRFYSNGQNFQWYCHYPENLAVGTHHKVYYMDDKTLYVTIKIIAAPTNEGVTTVMF